MTLHVTLEAASAVLAAIPLIAVSLALRRSPSLRLWLALAGFAILELRFIFLIVIHTVAPVAHFWEEIVEFVCDLTAIAMFAAAFLTGTQWFHGRSHTDVT